MAGITLRELARRTWQESWEDSVFGQAARLSFYHCIALFPTVYLATRILDAIGPGHKLLDTLESSLAAFMPSQAAALIHATLRQIRGGSAKTHTLAAVVSALWAAFNGTWALVSGLSQAYEVEERRPWWKIMAITAVLSFSFAVVALAGLIVLSIAPSALHWPIAVVCLLLAFSIAYRLAPDLETTRTRWSTPGAALATCLWLLATVGLRAYVLRASNSSVEIYGPAAAVAALLLWFYLTGAAILIGGELNSEIEKAHSPQGRRQAGHKQLRAG